MKSIFLAFAVCALSCGCQSAPSLSPEQKARFQETWALYQKNDSVWPSRREVALQDPVEREFLTQNWIREVVRGVDETKNPDLSKSPRAMRASAELSEVGASAVPLLMALFAAKDPSVADSSCRILARMGEKAMPGLLDGLESDDPLSRRWSLQALSWMSPPREEARAVAALADSDWSVRGAAAQALSRYKGAESARGLAKALSDSDPFVRKQAAETLAQRGEGEQIPALIAYLRGANSRLALEETEVAKTSLWILTKKNFGADAKAWQEWWERSKKNP